jgi:hypothetical protein
MASQLPATRMNNAEQGVDLLKHPSGIIPTLQ